MRQPPSDLCPYCLQREANSEDHIIPDFMGGQTTIRACQTCNNDLFGRQFEAQVASTLDPIEVALAQNGFKPRPHAVWRGAYTDPDTGLTFDADSEFVFRPSKPVIKRDAAGRVVEATYRTQREVDQLLDSMKRKGRQDRPEVRRNREKIVAPPLNELHVRLGTPFQKLALKMCVGLLGKFTPDVDHVDVRVRGFLLGDGIDEVPVRLATIRYPRKLVSLRPPLAHVVYVEGDASRKHMYGLVHLFGSIQYYIVLNSSYSGPDCAWLGFADQVNETESFQPVSPISFPEAPARISYNEAVLSRIILTAMFNDQVEKAFGQVNLYLTFTNTVFDGVRIDIDMDEQKLREVMGHIDSFLV